MLSFLGNSTILQSYHFKPSLLSLDLPLYHLILGRWSWPYFIKKKESYRNCFTSCATKPIYSHVPQPSSPYLLTSTTSSPLLLNKQTNKHPTSFPENLPECITYTHHLPLHSIHAYCSLQGHQWSSMSTLQSCSHSTSSRHGWPFGSLPLASTKAHSLGLPPTPLLLFLQQRHRYRNTETWRYKRAIPNSLEMGGFSHWGWHR